MDEYQPHMDGTVILARNGVADSMVLKVDQGPDFNYSAALKTVNIYKFSYATMKNLVIPALDRFVANGLTGVYYEAVFSELISSSRLRLGISLVGNRRWAEIDTIGDMREAEKIFSHSD